MRDRNLGSMIHRARSLARLHERRAEELMDEYEEIRTASGEGDSLYAERCLQLAGRRQRQADRWRATANVLSMEAYRVARRVTTVAAFLLVAHNASWGRTVVHRGAAPHSVVATWYRAPTRSSFASRHKGWRNHVFVVSTVDRSVRVVCRDWGPARWTRADIDLSKDAARRLGMIRKGRASVHIRRVR